VQVVFRELHVSVSMGVTSMAPSFFLFAFSLLWGTGRKLSDQWVLIRCFFSLPFFFAMMGPVGLWFIGMFATIRSGLCSWDEMAFYSNY